MNQTETTPPAARRSRQSLADLYRTNPVKACRAALRRTRDKAWTTSTAPARGRYASRADRRHYGRAVIRGKHYAWTGAGEGMACRLRALKHQPRRTP